MRVFITGATGLIGARLCDALTNAGDEVVALSRRAFPASDRGGGVSWVQGDPSERGEWMRSLDGVDGIVHLAGEGIAEGRWNEAKKRRLVSSRVASTQRLVEAMGQAERPPRVFVSASATGYYGPRGEDEIDEDSAPGDDFLARLCVDWESAAKGAESTGARVVRLRLGVVLSGQGGALERMVIPFRLGVGGPIGPAENWVPWIHADDVVGLLRFALIQPVAGPLNAVAPGAVRMRDFAAALGRVVGRPSWLPVPLFAMRVALGEAAANLFPGQHVLAARVKEAGYAFRFPEIEEALRDCVS